MNIKEINTNKNEIIIGINKIEELLKSIALSVDSIATYKFDIAIEMTRIDERLKNIKKGIE